MLENTNSFKFSKRSKKSMENVHPHLVAVMQETLRITDIDFLVYCGLRTEAEQKILVATGKSKTMNSRHLTGHAVDIAPLTNGQIDWGNYALFKELSETVKIAAKNLGIQILWGGNWDTLRDGPHYQLTWQGYPKDAEVKELVVPVAIAQPEKSAPAPNAQTSPVSVLTRAKWLFRRFNL